MTLNPIPALKRSRASGRNISDRTLSNFSGGLRRTDNETVVSTKYSIVLSNIFRNEENGHTLRYGTKEFARTASDILEQIYFADVLVCILKDGTIQTIDENLNVVNIWDATIAAALTGSPSAWSISIDHLDYTFFRDALILTNGVDKPLTIDRNLVVTYLQDTAIGTNIFTPITKFVTTVGNYCVMAGFNDTDEIFISSQGVAGVWPGDVAPNDSVSIKLGAYTALSGKSPKAVASFRNFLIVFFDEFLVTLELGIYNNAAVHEPKVTDTLQDTGVINHKTIVITDNDLIFAAKSGVFSAARNIFGGTLETKSISDDLNTDYSAETSQLPIDPKDCFMIRDQLENRIFLVLRKTDSSFTTFAASHARNFKQVAWSKIDGWSFKGGSVSRRKRTFFTFDNIVYQYGNRVFAGEYYTSDFILPGQAEDSGTEIVFDWEMPWTDIQKRIKTKQLIKLTADTKGSAEFEIQFFVDNFYKDINGQYDPALTLNLIAGQGGGYGQVNNPNFGGGRRANDERFFGTPSKFRILKLRIKGSTAQSLIISTISVIFSYGSYHR